jgi:hypothetical protein
MALMAGSITFSLEKRLLLVAIADFKINMAVQVRASLTLRAAAAMGFPEIVL